jgi:uncharacterized protein
MRMPPPRSAAWRHQDARDGFEVVFWRPAGAGHQVEGHTAAVERGETWAVHYVIDLDSDWRTLRARVTGWSASGVHERTLESAGVAGWLVDGKPAPHLDGCLDVDLESSALTNAFPARRLGLHTGEQADAPAAYIRAVDLSVQRLEQRYRRLPDEGSHTRYHYAAPAFEFECELLYDQSGLLIDYPGIATRAA